MCLFSAVISLVHKHIIQLKGVEENEHRMGQKWILIRISFLIERA